MTDPASTAAAAAQVAAIARLAGMEFGALVALCAAARGGATSAASGSRAVGAGAEPTDGPADEPAAAGPADEPADDGPAADEPAAAPADSPLVYVAVIGPSGRGASAATALLVGPGRFAAGASTVGVKMGRRTPCVCFARAFAGVPQAAHAALVMLAADDWSAPRVRELAGAWGARLGGRPFLLALHGAAPAGAPPDAALAAAAALGGGLCMRIDPGADRAALWRRPELQGLVRRAAPWCATRRG